MQASGPLLTGVVSSALTHLFWSLPELPCSKVCMHAVHSTWSSGSESRERGVHLSAWQGHQPVWSPHVEMFRCTHVSAEVHRSQLCYAGLLSCATGALLHCGAPCSSIALYFIMVLLETKVTLDHVKLLHCDLDLMPSDALTATDREALQSVNQHVLQKLQTGNISGALRPSCPKHAYMIIFESSITVCLRGPGV